MNGYPYWNLDLILAFREHLAAGWPQIATRGSQTLRYEPATIQVILADCPQMLTCPDCGDLIESDSVDSVPEGRVCHDCGGVWRVAGSEPTGERNFDDTAPLLCWTLKRQRERDGVWGDI